MSPIDNVLLIGLPYAAIIVFFVGTIYRYKAARFTYSSLSSQFLEGRKLFWGSVPFHWGILVLFVGHLIAFSIPRTLLAFNRVPARLLVIEMSALICGLLVLIGLITLFLRRIRTPRLSVVTTKMDLVVEVALILQVAVGIIMAMTLRWGSSWFALVLTPYLRSVLTFRPDITAVAALPWLVKAHIAGAFLIIGLIPFSRLVHLLVVPLHYIWRPYQRVIWPWDRREVRNDDAEWSRTRPQSN